MLIVTTFKYLGWVLTAYDDEWPEFEYMGKFIWGFLAVEVRTPDLWDILQGGSSGDPNFCLGDQGDDP